jgi:hypothetical protein
MSFVIGLILFIGLLGYLDSRLPWPRPENSRLADGR